MNFLSTKLKTNNEISIHMKNDDDGFITNSDNGDVFEINSTTKLIVEKCTGNLSLSEIYHKLKEENPDIEFEVTEHDIIELGKFLIENKICSNT